MYLRFIKIYFLCICTYIYIYIHFFYIYTYIYIYQFVIKPHVWHIIMHIYSINDAMTASRQLSTVLSSATWVFDCGWNCVFEAMFMGNRHSSSVSVFLHCRCAGLFPSYFRKTLCASFYQCACELNQSLAEKAFRKGHNTTVYACCMCASTGFFPLWTFAQLLLTKTREATVGKTMPCLGVDMIWFETNWQKIFKNRKALARFWIFATTSTQRALLHCSKLS